jgi:hypothetical protein
MLYQLSYSRPKVSTTFEPKIRPRLRPCKGDGGAASRTGRHFIN